MSETIEALSLSSLPKLGQTLADGLFAGLTTKPDGTHCAIVLLPAKPEATLTWKKAVSWAESVGGELPGLLVSASLFANVSDQFERDWYWTGEAFDGSYAWYQYFSLGVQYFSHKSAEGRARAVRMIPLNP